MPEPPQLVPLEAEEHSKSECSFTGKLRASSSLWQTGLTIASLPRLQLLTVEKIKASVLWIQFSLIYFCKIISWTHGNLKLFPFMFTKFCVSVDFFLLEWWIKVEWHKKFHEIIFLMVICLDEWWCWRQWSLFLFSSEALQRKRNENTKHPYGKSFKIK